MKTNKKILIASGSMLAAGMAHGQITYTPVNQTEGVSDSGYTFDLDGVNPGFEVFFDGSNASKPCVLGTVGAANPTPDVLNELLMTPANTDNTGVPVMPFGTPINSQVTVGTNTVAVGYTDQH